MGEVKLIEDKKLSKEKIEQIDNSINLEIVEKTVNDNLELLRGKFTEDENNLLKIEQNLNQNNFKSEIEKIFDNRLDKNPDIIKLVINLSFIEKQKEEQIENIIIQEGVNLNTTKNLIGLENSLKEVGEKNNKKTENYKPPEQLSQIVGDIEKIPNTEIKEIPKIKELIKEGKFTEVINQIFTFLSSFIFGKKGSIGLEEYKDLDIQITGLGLDQKTLFELGKILEEINSKIDQTNDINKKMRFTYVLTAIKNEQIKREESKKLNKYELLLKNLEREGKYNSGIQAGQVLLINKENKEYKSNKAKLGDKLLSTFNNISGHQTNFLHSVVISRIEGNEIYITHSTLQKKDGKPGIEEKKLTELIGGYTGADILVMDMPDENKEKMLKFTKEKLDEQNKNPDNSLYDDKIVTSNITGYGNPKNEKVNCVELISEGLGDEKIKGVGIPNDLLQSNILRPSYLTSI